MHVNFTLEPSEIDIDTHTLEMKLAALHATHPPASDLMASSDELPTLNDLLYNETDIEDLWTSQ